MKWPTNEVGSTPLRWWWAIHGFAALRLSRGQYQTLPSIVLPHSADYACSQGRPPHGVTMTKYRPKTDRVGLVWPEPRRKDGDAQAHNERRNSEQYDFLEGIGVDPDPFDSAPRRQYPPAPRLERRTDCHGLALEWRKRMATLIELVGMPTDRSAYLQACRTVADGLGAVERQGIFLFIEDKEEGTERTQIVIRDELDAVFPPRR